MVKGEGVTEELLYGPDCPPSPTRMGTPEEMTPNEIGLHNLRKINEDLDNPNGKFAALQEEMRKRRFQRHLASELRDFNPVCRARRSLPPLEEVLKEIRG